MNKYTSRFIGFALVSGAMAGLFTSTAAVGSEDATAANWETVNDSFHNGGYLAPMGSVLLNLGSGDLGTRFGGTLAAGYRKDYFAIEARGFYAISPSSSSNVRLYGGSIEGLMFPFRLSGSTASDQNSFRERLRSNIYVIAGGGTQDLRNYPNTGNMSLGTTIINGGLGDIIPFRWNQYEFGLRVEALYQHGFRDKSPKSITSGDPDLNAPTNFNDVIFNIGLHLPFGLTRVKAATPEPPVEVVPVVKGASAAPNGASPPPPQTTPVQSDNSPSASAPPAMGTGTEANPAAPTEQSPAPVAPGSPPTKPSEDNSELDSILGPTPAPSGAAPPKK